MSAKAEVKIELRHFFPSSRYILLLMISILVCLLKIISVISGQAWGRVVSAYVLLYCSWWAFGLVKNNIKTGLFCKTLLEMYISCVLECEGELHTCGQNYQRSYLEQEYHRPYSIKQYSSFIDSARLSFCNVRILAECLSYNNVFAIDWIKFWTSGSLTETCKSYIDAIYSMLIKTAERFPPFQ